MKKRLTLLSKRLFNPDTPLFGIGILAAAIICALVGVVVWVTFLKGLPGTEFNLSLQNYIEVLTNPVTRLAGQNTLISALGTVLVTSFFAVPMAWLIHRTNIRGKQFFISLMLLKILLPGFLGVMGWIMLGSPSIGIVNQALRIIIPAEIGPLSVYNIPTIAFLQGMAFTPTAFFMIAGAFVAIDPCYEEAAEVSGASKLHSMRRIMLPLVFPALVAAVIYTFMSAVSIYEVPALLGQPLNIHMFSTLMFDTAQPREGIPNYGIGGVYGVLTIVPTLFALFYYQRMLKKSYRYATVTGKGYRPKLTVLGKWKTAGLGFIVLYFTLDLLLPFLAVLWASFLPRIQLPSGEALHNLNLDGYRAAFLMLSEGKVLTNTVQLVFLVGLLTVVIGLVFSWIVIRTHMPGRYVIDTISVLPHAIPGIAFALSVTYVGILLAKVIPIYGTLISIILADTIILIPFATRTINGSLIQIHPELVEAVQVCGGSRITAIKKIIVPLMKPALFYSFTWSVLIAYREVTIALFLSSPKNMVMATTIWHWWQRGDNSAAAAAMGVIMVLGMGTIMMILLKVYPNLLGAREL